MLSDSAGYLLKSSSYRQHPNSQVDPAFESDLLRDAGSRQRGQRDSEHPPMQLKLTAENLDELVAAQATGQSITVSTSHNGLVR